MQLRFNPFPGLRSFQPDEEHLFFGRERQIDELLRRLRVSRFLSVVGASGSGKSSLVRSGLIPALHSGYMVGTGSSWRIAELRPGADPIGNLAAALDSPGIAGGDPLASDLNRPLLEATLRRSALGLVQSIRNAHIDAADNVLVLVDQFEELFRFKQARATAAARDEAVAFVRLLVEAAQDSATPIYVALTMRSEFIGQCTQFPGLAEAVNDGLYLVPRLTRDELSLAITGPVSVGGGEVAPRLVTRLLNDVGDDPDQLPILQHALMRTWSYWDAQEKASGAIDLPHYEAIGGMRNALSLHAEEAYSDLTTDADRHVAEHLFKALVEMTPQGGVRRPCRVDVLCQVAGVSREAVIAVLERFRMPGCSFLMPPSDTPLEDSTIVDLSHESLMRLWERLVGWTHDEARSAEIYTRLSEAAARHARNEAALWRDPELQLAVQWRDTSHPTAAWAARYDTDFTRAMIFLDESRHVRDEAAAERRRYRRRQFLIVQSTAAVMFVLFVLAGVSLWFALDARNEARAQRAAADEQRQAAERRAEEARTAQTETDQQRQVALQQSELAREQEEKASQASRQALNERNRAENERMSAEAARQLAEGQRREAESQRAIADEQRLVAQRQEQAAQAAASNAEAARRKAEQASEAEKVAAAAAASARDERARLQYLSLARALAGESTRRFDRNDVQVLLARQAYNLAVKYGGDPEAPEIATALRRSLESLGGNDTRVFLGHADAVRALALSPDGLRLATGSDDGRVRLFDVRGSANPTATLPPLGSPARSVAFNRQGTRLAAGTLDGRIHVWAMSPPAVSKPLRSWQAHSQAVNGLAFDSRDALVSVGAEGQVSLWQPDTFAADAASPGAQPFRLAAAALDRRMERLAAVGEGGVLVWNLRMPGPPIAFGQGLRATAVAFSDDGRWLVAGTASGQLVYWDSARPGEAVKQVSVHRASVTALRFEGSFLASASLDGDVKLWPAKPEGLDAQPLVLEHGAWVWGLAFTPSGDTLISGGADRRVRAWPTRAQALADEACRRVNRNLTEAEWRLYVTDLPYAPTCPGVANRSPQ
jgi:WD40 repeat protein